MLQTECGNFHHLQTINTHVCPNYCAKYLYTSLPVHCVPDHWIGIQKFYTTITQIQFSQASSHIDG